jgi:hypothetical protein
MLNFSLPDADAVDAVAARLSGAGLELVPAGVAVLVLTALGAALVITALRRRDQEAVHPRVHESDEPALARAGRVDA